MDLGSEFSIREVVEDNEEISNISESRVQNDDHNELFPEVKQNGADKRKGKGLKKWRRIKRDTKKASGGGEIVMTHELLNSDVILCKHMQYSERKQKSEGSVSSTNAIVQNFEDFGGLGVGPPFAAGTDSENSEDRSSKSSTAASAPKLKNEMPVLISGRMRSVSGKNMGRAETTKKARGEQRVNIEKENSHSSLESDSRSSNFLFMQGTYSTGNGTPDERLKGYDGENGDEVQGSDEQQVTDGHRGGVYGEGRYEGLSTEGCGVADSSSEVKEDRSENHGSSSDQDPLDESLFALQSAQEALEKEVLEFQEINKDVSVDDSVSDIGTDFIDDEQETSFSRAVQSEVVETGYSDTETEFEDLFKQKIEAEVEYMAMSRTVQNLRVAALDQITILEEQIALASEQMQILDKLGVAENKAAMIEKEAEKLEKMCGDIASSSEIMKLRNGVFKYSSCFVLQLVLLIAILGFFIFHLLPSYVGVVPT
ncbi:WPP domain-interacting protein 1 [Phtheirospermum japonicum]|uniref:WPP domain-interacting protein 1 n=1 Tax=Phtheirospermum japonicum TaxID=374723 RepID=A0A830C581_9LAMI|nr:WPP domain-interacting protein 1 [Phtheirospermum japonicum]